MPNPGSTQFTPVSATPSGGTITAGGTYQVALAANPNRTAGFIQNNSAANVMYVHLGTATPTHAKSVQVPKGAFFNFNLGFDGLIFTGAILVDGTTADPFTVVEVV